MWSRSGTRVLVAAAAMVLTTTLPWAASKNFVPDVVFKGSTLTGWHPLGQSDWRAQDGEIIGTPKSSGGWLVLDRGYQDVAFTSTFRCAPGCRTGLLFRAEKTADGGLKGIFVSLTEGDLVSYRVTLDPQGNETSRERLRPGPAGQVRSAPPPSPTPAGGPAAGRGGAAPGGGPGRGGPGAGGGAPTTPVPIPRPSADLRPDDWNTIEVVIDANILRAFLNNVGGVSGGVADDEYGQFGPIALYAGGTGEVRFKEVGYKDLQPRVALPEQVSSHFRMQALNEFYYSWGPSVADINHDNVPDIVAGPYYYLGPDYTTAREIYLAQTIDASTQYFNGLQFAYDFTGDGWPDVINVLFTRPVVLYVNPRGEPRRWEKFTVTDNLTCELGLLKDVDGDGKPELLFKDSENQFVFARPDPAHPTDMWVKHPISEKGPWANHGMGVGDINGDGRMDFANAYGWWEQPPKGTDGPWPYHAEAFGVFDRSSPGGAEMAIYDVNGDGLNDIVTSLQAHGWGLAWFEQKKSATGPDQFREAPDHGGLLHDQCGRRDFLGAARIELRRHRRRRDS